MSAWGRFFLIIFSSPSSVEQGLDFLLGHFEDFVWPRTISTQTTQGRQITVYNKEEAMATANSLDCRINAYPSSKYVKRYIKQTPNFLFIDLDSQVTNLDKELNQVLTNIKLKFEDDAIEPTVLWSGKGYHIYLPVNAIVLEYESLFEDIEVYDPSRKFIQWSEQHLSDNKADLCHSKGVSFNNCMLRVPGSINSKVNRQVTIIQRWNGVKPSIKPLLYDFYIHLVDTRLREVQGIRIKNGPAGKKFHSYWESKK